MTDMLDRAQNAAPLEQEAMLRELGVARTELYNAMTTLNSGVRDGTIRVDGLMEYLNGDVEFNLNPREGQKVSLSPRNDNGSERVQVTRKLREGPVTGYTVFVEQPLFEGDVPSALATQHWQEYLTSVESPEWNLGLTDSQGLAALLQGVIDKGSARPEQSRHVGAFAGILRLFGITQRNS